MSTDWNQCYRDGETPWDKGAPAPPLLEWLEAPGHSLTGEVLVPGCGLGYDVRAIAATGQAAEVWGLDISPAALEHARNWPKVGNETYLEADLFNMPLAFHARYGWVFEHTCFCAIDPSRRTEYVRAVAQALQPGGRLLAIFYLNPWKASEAPPDGGPPFDVTIAELDALFAGYFDLLEEATPTRAYPGREQAEVIRLLAKAR